MTSNITAEIRCSNTKENQKTALITGITGQDGSYLTELLLSKNYKVYGLVRPCSLAPNTSRIDHLLANENLIIRFGDLSDTCSILKILSEVKPDEIYNLASLTHVKISFDISEYTSQINGLGTLKILESLKSLNLLNSCKFYQASTSEMFGNSPAPQNETSPFIPNSPYANAKLFSYHTVRIFRESYNLFACNGILFNHESPRRSYNFVTRKITRAVAAIKLGKQKTLILGNLNAYRDWGHTKDYVYAMWLMVQQDKSDDFVIATGVRTCVRDFVEIAFLEVGIEIKGLDFFLMVFLFFLVKQFIYFYHFSSFQHLK